MRYFVAFLSLVLGFCVAPVGAEELNFGKMTTSQLEDIYKFYDYDGTRGYLMLPIYHLQNCPAVCKSVLVWLVR